MSVSTIQPEDDQKRASQALDELITMSEEMGLYKMEAAALADKATAKSDTTAKPAVTPNMRSDKQNGEK